MALEILRKPVTFCHDQPLAQTYKKWIGLAHLYFNQQRSYAFIQKTNGWLLSTDARLDPARTACPDARGAR